METLLNLLCPYPRGSQERDLGLMLIAIALCYLASVKIRPMPPNLDRCNACGYPRTGLDAVAVCPECGFQARTEPPPMTGLQLRPGWRVNLPLSIGLFWLDIVLIRVAMLISYLFDHFSISSALLVMHRRELLAHSYDLVYCCNISVTYFQL
ncbi:MAG: hypothetical protein NTV94_12465, partial [Planctomycetota bacterium]|nr:hypothetical protein [Planctomycetota bacterium]